MQGVYYKVLTLYGNKTTLLNTTITITLDQNKIIVFIDML